MVVLTLRESFSSGPWMLIVGKVKNFSKLNDITALDQHFFSILHASLRFHNEIMEITLTITGHLICPRHHPKLFTQTTSRNHPTPSTVDPLPPKPLSGQEVPRSHAGGCESQSTAAGHTRGAGSYTPLRLLNTMLTSSFTSSPKEENAECPLSNCSVYVPPDFLLQLVSERDEVKTCPHGWVLLFESYILKSNLFGDGQWESSHSPWDINYSNIKNQLIKHTCFFNKKKQSFVSKSYWTFLNV